MDARYYSGSDDREFSPPPDEDEEACPRCGVTLLADCLPSCDCPACEQDRVRAHRREGA